MRFYNDETLIYRNTKEQSVWKTFLKLKKEKIVRNKKEKKIKKKFKLVKK